MSAQVINFRPRVAPIVTMSVAADGTWLVAIKPCPPEWPKPEAEFWDEPLASAYAGMLSRKFGCPVVGPQDGAA